MATKKNTIPQEVTEVFDEVKEAAQDVGGWRMHASIEEKVTTIVGILLFAWGLWFLKHLIGGIILLLIGGVLISGFLNQPVAKVLKKISNFRSKEKPSKAKEEKEPKDTKGTKKTSKTTKK